MLLSINVQKNNCEVLRVDVYEDGQSSSDGKNPLIEYCYAAIHPETGKQTNGSVLHERRAGAEALLAIVLADIAAKVNPLSL